VTGAGDSFWSGFITAYLEGRPVGLAACFGQAVAEEKLGYAGPLQPLADPAGLAARAEAIYAGANLAGTVQPDEFLIESKEVVNRTDR
jgi:hypothetical protein